MAQDREPDQQAQGDEADAVRPSENERLLIEAGASQKKQRAAKIASSTQLARFTQGQRAPGTGLRSASRDPLTGAACSAGRDSLARD